MRLRRDGVRPDVLARVLRERRSFLDAAMAGVYTVPGDGCVDFAAALRPLAEAGYAYLRSSAGEAGFVIG